MIYFISNQIEIGLVDDAYRVASILDVKNYLENLTEVSVDTETTGLDAHTDKLQCIQVGDYHNQFVIDCSNIDISFLKPYLESKLLILQNAKFDYKFLYKKGIYPRKTWDTFLVERVLWCGIPEHRAGLQYLAKQYLDLQLDKSAQSTIVKEGLTTRNILYAAEDVKWLEKIKEKQLIELDKKKLMGTANLENRFVSCLAYIEYCGFKLDTEKWKKKMASDLARLTKDTELLNNWVLSKNISKFINPQLSLFDEVSCSVNWSSPKQVIELFENLGIDCTIVEKGVIKKSVEASNIEKQKDKSDLIPIYLSYKQNEKTVGTYGKSFLEQINPTTKRLHTKFTQIMDTGRMSSGGKDSNIKFINFQNIPSDKETRHSFVSEPGNVLVVADYNSQESVVLCNKSLEKGLLEFYDKGYSDMHSYNASKIYPELANLSFAEIKEKHNDKRQLAKVGGFALSYGGNGKTIANQLNLPIEEGERFYKLYFEAFSDLKGYFKKMEEQVIRDGYVQIDYVVGRKSFIPGFDFFKNLASEINSHFWEKWKELKNDTSNPEYTVYKKKIKDYFQFKGEMARKGANFPIQGTSASITKIAGVNLFDWIVDENLFSIVRICNVVHDEYVLECPSNLGEIVKNKLEECMVKGGSYFCKRVALKATGVIDDKWIH